jgi:hypothetical protein
LNIAGHNTIAATDIAINAPTAARLLIGKLFRERAGSQRERSLQEIAGGVPLAWLRVLRERRTSSFTVPHWWTIVGIEKHDITNTRTILS